MHVHIPEGSVPKDGPSAGITMAVALVSAFTGVPVRHDLAMTGEVTLRGKVLPIGGLKEKILAAKQHEISEVLVPEDNRKDLAEIPENLREGMTFHHVDSLAEVIRLALARDPLHKAAAAPGRPPGTPRARDAAGVEGDSGSDRRAGTAARRVPAVSR